MVNVKNIAANKAFFMIMLQTIGANVNELAISIIGVRRILRQNIPPTFITLDIMVSTIKANINFIIIAVNGRINILVKKIFVTISTQGIMMLKTIIANVGKIANIVHRFNVEILVAMLAKAIIFIETILTNVN